MHSESDDREFRPWPLLGRPMIQTILPTLLATRKFKATRYHTIEVEGGDKIVVAENQGTDLNRAVVIIHGLTGDQDSAYNCRLAKKLSTKGCLVWRVNLRGCGPGFGLARKTYHAGQSKDLGAVIDRLRNLHPLLKISVLGFSLGANLMLKYLSEPGRPEAIDHFIAVSPPFDLLASALKLKQNYPWFDRYFVKRLTKEVEKLTSKFPELEGISLHPEASLFDFDDQFTAPMHGFSGARDYYLKSSCGPLLSSLALKGTILIALDDPIIGYNTIPNLASNIELICCEKGGHVGFFGGQNWHDQFWMDSLIITKLAHRMAL